MATLPASLSTAATAFWDWLRRAFAGDVSRLPVYKQVRDFFGADFSSLETHHKHFPGFDVASLNQALDSFLAECCDSSRKVGSLCLGDLRLFFDNCRANPYYRGLKPVPPVYERVPIDVDEEASTVVNGLALAVLKSDSSHGDGPGRNGVPTPPVTKGTPAPERLAVLLAMTPGGPDAWEDMDGARAPRQQVAVSVACRNRAVADRFFRELEARRQRLSVYRGKVIDPVLHGGAVHAIQFRALKRVQEEDLVLPDDVRRLLHGAVIGFYAHEGLLRELGIELKRGVLLHGPPGTGKTSIALYLAGLLPRFTVCFVSGERLLYPREVCRLARYLQPAMVVFEDIDLVATARDANGLATVLGELMNQIDGCEPTDQVLFLMTTNSLERLEGAVRNRPGRVDQIVEVPLPGAEDRRRLIAHFARAVTLEPGALDRAMETTAGMTPAMLKEVVKRAAVSAVERNGSHGSGLTIRESELLLAARQVQALREPIAVPGRLGFRESAV
jgi:energy-coupling factor transporter ATP-binding protein EcfA2